MSNKRIIVILESNIHEGKKLKEELSESDFEVINITDKTELFDLIHNGRVGIVLMNLVLEEDDAISICLEIRNKKNLPQPIIAIYTDKHEDYIQIAAFNAGADDFIEIPIASCVLAARCKALLRRKVNHQVKKQYKNNLTIDFESYQIIKGEKSFSLPPKQFEILNLLLSVPEKVFTRKEIALKLWNDADVAKLRTIDIHISAIRKCLGNDVIRTVKGVGYCFAG